MTAGRRVLPFETRCEQKVKTDGCSHRKGQGKISEALPANTLSDCEQALGQNIILRSRRHQEKGGPPGCIYRRNRVIIYHTKGIGVHEDLPNPVGAGAERFQIPFPELLQNPYQHPIWILEVSQNA